MPDHRISAVLFCILSMPLSSQSADRYVDTQNSAASDANPGTASRPFKTISAAVINLQAGDHVYIRAGDYRERVNIYAYTGSTSQPVVIQAYPGDEGRVFIKGSEVFTDWSPDSGSQWSTAWPYHLDPAYPSSWSSGPEYDQAYIHRAEMAFADGQPLQQVTSSDQMRAGTFFVDDGAQRIFVWLADGSSPSNHRMELAVRQDGFVIGGNNYQVSGLTVTHVADQYGSAAFGASGNNFTLQNNVIEWNNLDGLHIDANAATLTGNTASFNGGVGITGGPQNSTLQGNFTDNNSWRFGPDNHAGGMKLVGNGPSNNVISHHVSRNNNGPGMWCDTDCQNNRFEECLIDNNNFEGILLENSGSNTILNSIVTRTHAWNPLWRESGAGIMLSSTDSPKLYNNTIAGNDNYGILIYGDTRDYQPANSTIVDNIIALNGVGGLYFGIYGSSNSTSVIASHHLDYNLWFQPSGYVVSYPSGQKEIETGSLQQWQSAYGQDAHSRTGDPQFANWPAADVSLTPGSPAIDAGLQVANVTRDYGGTLRPQGAAFDIGAYESSSSGNGTAGTMYLSDLSWISATNGWGPVERDMSNGEIGGNDGHTISIRGATYPKGLGVHANSSVLYNLQAAGSCTGFSADIGVDDETHGAGSVVFQVFADGTKLYDSGVITGTMPVQSISVSITGRLTLNLIVNDAGDGGTSDHADWAGARLLCQ